MPALFPVGKSPYPYSLGLAGGLLNCLLRNLLDLHTC
jgi:hypothetical protein